MEPEADWRQLAHSSIVAYAIANDIGYVASRHHHVIAGCLERVVRGELKRLMIFVPPQHGKSRLVSETLPPFYHGHHPSHHIIHLAYGADFVERFGRANRNKMQGAIHQAVFGTALAGDSARSDRYHTAQHGQYVATGIRGGITGNPADLIIVDDPIKSRGEVNSPKIMETIRNNISSGIRSRMHDNTAIIVMHTRWDEADPAGYMLEAWGHEDWEILSLPALVETPEQAANDPLGRSIGEALWPERFSAAFLLSTKKALLPRDWSALYQQAPNPDEGALFSREDFNWYDPEELNPLKDFKLYGAHDGAVATPEEGRDPDVTELGVWGVDCDWNLYAVDWWSCQWDLHEWGETLLDMAEDWGIKKWVSESGVIRHASESFLKRRIIDRRKEGSRLALAFEWLPHIGDKESNVASFRAMVKQGKVFFPLNTLWAEELVEQLLKFPAGRYDDKVDNCGFIGRLLYQMIAKDSGKRGRKTAEYGTMDWLLSYADEEIRREGRKKERRRRR